MCHPTARVNLVNAPLLGADVQVGRRTTLVGHSDGLLILDDGAWVGDDCEIEVFGTVRIGQNVSVQHRSQLHGDVEIGAGCVCAANLYISSTAHRFRDVPHMPIRWQDAYGGLNASTGSRPVVVEEDCWIGINVVICPGVTVGRGSVVGANAVVTTSVPPYAVVAGTPARAVGNRLAFVPPSVLLANRPEDIPYFYAGFVMPVYGQDWERDVAVNGRGVRKRFALAVQVREQESLQIEVLVKSPVRLLHGEQEAHFSTGVATATFKAMPNERGLLWFSVPDWTPGCLAVKSVSVAAKVDMQGVAQA